MKSLFKTIIVPYGERYNNEEDNLILNTSINIKDFTYVNRIGKVITPSHFNPIVEKDDLVIVHHNVFRQFWNFGGRLKTSTSDLDNGTFGCNNDSIYAYKRGDSDWITLGDSCFVEPQVANREDFVWDMDFHTPGVGKLVYGAPDGFKQGDTVTYTPYSKYEFNIEGKKLYKMKHMNITGKIL